jgi:hypothetical protein
MKIGDASEHFRTNVDIKDNDDVGAVSLCGCGFCRAAMRTNAMFVRLALAGISLLQNGPTTPMADSRQGVAKLDSLKHDAEFQRQRYDGTSVGQVVIATRNRAWTGPCDL